jgi:Rhs element Vgr protein
MPVIPTNIFQNNARRDGVVTFTILSEGTAVPSTVEVHSIDIWQELNRIPRAKIAILDGSASEQTFRVSDEDWFIPGKSIEILVGFSSDEATIFSGIVTGQTIKVRPGGNSVLMVECADPAIKMTTNPRSKYFYDMAESDLFETLITGYSGLLAEVEPTGHTHKEILQYQSTDWDFMLSRADVNGLFCLADGGTLYIASPDFTQEPAATIAYGQNLLEIDAELDCVNQFSSVKSTSWDYSQSENSEVEAVSSSPLSPGNISSPDLADSLENSELVLRAGAKISGEILQKWANAKLMKQELAKVRGRAKVEGIGALKPGTVIKLEGVGDRFNGSAFVSGVKHTVYRGDWTTDIQFGLSSKWFTQEYDVSEKPAAAMLPSVSGLQIGLVTQIESDPDGDNRILIRLPMIDAAEQGIWARVASVGSGDSRGFVYRPEIGDEVVVGFIHDDPNQPIILGSVNSSVNPSPIPPSDDNHEKGIITRGEIKFLINDDHPSVLIEMPSGKKISINDDDAEISITDEHGNHVIMNRDGLSLESPSDISVKATGDLNLEGTNVNVKANASLKAEGSASADVSSTGTTTIQGSLVQIN